MTDYDEVVHVETLKEYRAVLDKWFDKGYDFFSNLGTQDLHEEYFTKLDAQYLTLQASTIGYYLAEPYTGHKKLKAVSFKEFMAKEQGVTPWVPAPEDIPEREVTYNVSEEQMAFIKEVKESPYPASYLVINDDEYMNMFYGVYGTIFERDLLRYLGGDERVVFQLKDPLFMLKGKDTDGDIVYFTVDGVGAPTYTYDKPDAFTASHEEITLWNTPFWEIEPVDA